MTTPPDEPDDSLADLLASYEDGRGGQPLPPATPSGPLSPEGRERLEKDRAFLDFLADAWPRLQAGAAEGTPATIGRFQVLRQLGQGGFGVVFLAWDTAHRRQVALKVPRLEALVTPGARERFFREGRLAAGLDHPNLVPVYEVGEVGAVAYIASAYAPGVTLGEWRLQHPGTVAPKEAVALVATLAEAVAYLHGRGVVHRDLKPGNVLLEQVEATTGEVPAAGGVVPPFGVPRITDFGLAKLMDQPPGEATTGGALLGSPPYMAPEQALDQREAIGPRTDVYALGVILFELLAGRHPFQGRTPLETLRQVAGEEPPALRSLVAGLPRDLETVCQRCLHKSPARRYAGAAELAADLRRFLAGQPLLARPLGVLERTARWARRRPARAVALAFGAAFVLAGALALAGHLRSLHEALDATDRERDRAVRNEGRAERNRAAALDLQYASDLALAAQDFKGGDLFQLPGLLDRHLPQAGADDRRDFLWWHLRSHCRPARPALQAHDGPLHLLAYTPDGRSLVTAGGRHESQRLKVWDLATGRLRFQRPLGGNVPTGEQLSLAAFAPGRGGLLAGITAGDKVILWNAETGAELAQLPQAWGANYCSLSRDGQVLAVGGERPVAVWDCAAKRQVCTVPGPTDWVALAPDGQSLVRAVQSAPHCEFRGLPKGTHRGQLVLGAGVRGLAYSPRGTFLLTTDYSQGAVWDITGQTALEWQPPIGPVESLAISDDKRTLAAGGHGGAVRLWDVRSRRLLARYRWQPNPIVRLTFSPDGHTLAAATAEGAVHHLDATARHVPDGLHPTTAKNKLLAWSPDGKVLAVWVAPDRLQLLDSRTGEARTELHGSVSAFTNALFSPDGHTLATTTFGKKIIRLWDTKTGRLRCETGPHVDACSPPTFSPDARILYSVDADGVRCWDTATGAGRGLLGAARASHAVAVSPDGRTLVTGGSALCVWDLSGGRVPAQPVCTVPLAAPVVPVGITPDGRTLVTNDSSGGGRLWKVSSKGQLTPDGPELPVGGGGQVLGYSLGRRGSSLAVLYLHDVLLWDLKSRRIRHRIRWPAREGRWVRADLLADGRTLATLGENGAVQLWDLDTWQVRRPAGEPLLTVASLAFAPDGRTLLTGSAPAGRAVWNNNGLYKSETAPLGGTAETVRCWDATTGLEERAALPNQETMAPPSVVACSPDGGRVAAGAEDGSVWVWDKRQSRLQTRVFLSEKARSYAERSEAIRRLSKESNPDYWKRTESVRSLAFSPDSGLLAVVGSRGSLRVWETAAWKGRFAGQENGPLEWVAFSPDSARVAAVRGSQVLFWDARTGQRLGTLGDEGGVPLLCGAFAPAGGLLATGAKDGGICLWDVGTGSVKARLVNHRDRVASLAFTPEGRTLASASWDRTVRLWSVTAAQEVAALEAHQGRVLAVAFSPDGTVLASGGELPTGAGEVFLCRAPRP
jgi:WD40 repeat protein